MESKMGSQTAIHHEQEFHEKSHPHPAHGIVDAAHLFQEDSSGRVTGRLLIPRPTEDPKDPLTWSLWRKHLALATICFFVFLSNYITASITPILVHIIQDFEVSLTKASYLITFNILFLGIGNLFWIPLSLKIGKRPVLLLSSAIFFASSIWAAVAQSWGSLFGARIIQGFGASSSEALGPSVVADLYFLHERGTKVGVYTFMIAGGSALGGTFAGLVADANPDWRWVFWMNTILTGVCFLNTVLFQAETNFQRPGEFETGEGLESSRLASIRARANPSWFKSLKITSWYDRETSIWWLWWRPFLMLQYPAVVWGSITYGVTLGWVVLQQTANASAFPELYGFSELAVGNINLAVSPWCLIDFLC
ncbi:uncharacterized protein Z518_00142 [Rhinocladiella mackenziei CBS 650.93]|uniref:Major facilitator superfamily (MFS) profile domain-containing protein n=1 Tax=Rhinocladiella mackenziei CBS 650.93 TaxID=1442369 RepID=A0A0D2ISV9_9EURO|nr:uncharacterized protein Z518_00142 [Rhinocladiella mackenziei CBS 650.93]KIX09064.1 hypothetical protein Z518_00142 [Rhinocladiella mackenziei CBS 650.93]